MTLPEKPWTVLAYLVADDKGGGSDASRVALDKAVQSEILAICRAADLTEMHVAIQVDYSKIPGAFRAKVFTEPPDMRFWNVDPAEYIVWRQIAEQIRNVDLALLKGRERNAARTDVLKDFLRWGRTECPARNYAIVFWGHSNGPMGLFYDNTPGEREAQTLSLNNLEAALQSPGEPASVVLFRDCFMSTLEAAYQLQGVAKYAIASQSLVPIEGNWPYRDLFSTLLDGGHEVDMVTKLAARLGEYHDHEANREPFADVPITLLDIGEVKTLTRPLIDLVEALDETRTDAQLTKSHREAFESARRGAPDTPENPGDPALVDVIALCQGLRRDGAGTISEISKEIERLLTEKVIMSHHSQRDSFRGVSVFYRPLSEEEIQLSCIEPVDLEQYATLELNTETAWGRIAFEPVGAS